MATKERKELKWGGKKSPASEKFLAQRAVPSPLPEGVKWAKNLFFCVLCVLLRSFAAILPACPHTSTMFTAVRRSSGRAATARQRPSPLAPSPLRVIHPITLLRLFSHVFIPAFDRADQLGLRASPAGDIGAGSRLVRFRQAQGSADDRRHARRPYVERCRHLHRGTDRLPRGSAAAQRRADVPHARSSSSSGSLLLTR